MIRLGASLLIAGHYLLNHPLAWTAGPALDGAFALPWRELLLAVVVVVGACGAGVRWVDGDPVEQVVGGLVIGTLATTLSILALGLAGAFTRGAFACVAAALLMACRWAIGPIAEIVRRAGAGRLALLAVLVAPPLAQALAPPIVYDALSYHLPEPRRFLEAGVISKSTTGQLGHYPFALEMLFALGMSLTSDRAPGLIGFGYYLALLLSVAALARRVGAPAWRAALLVALVPVAQRLAGGAKPDFAMAFALTAATTFALKYRETRAPRDAAVAAAAVALAAGFKLLGGLLALPVLALIARAPARVLAIAVLAAAPWYVKTALWTTNPAYPAGNALVYRYTRAPVLKDGWFSEHPALAHLSGDALVQAWGSGLDPLLPYRLSVDSREPKPDEPPAHFGGELSPLFLMFLVLAPFPARHAKTLAGLAALQFLMVSCVAQQARFYVPVLALLAPLAAPRGRPALALAALVGGWGLAGSFLLAHGRGDLPAALGLLTERAFLERNVECQRAFDFANRSLEDAKILLVYEQRTYPLRVPSIGADNWLPLTALELLVPARSLPELLQSLRARGITHLYISRFGLALLPEHPVIVALLKSAERTYVDDHGFLLGLPKG